MVFAVFWSNFSALKMPTMMARTIISPAEEIANEIFEIRLRDRGEMFVFLAGNYELYMRRETASSRCTLFLPRPDSR